MHSHLLGIGKACSALEVVDALDDILKREELCLLVKFEQDNLFVQVLHLFFPLLELFALDRTGVTRWSSINKALHFDKLSSCVPKEATRTEVF